MADERPGSQHEEQVGLEHADAFEITTDGKSVTGRRLFADGGDGEEKEINVLDPVAGASSTLPASSGVPSAMRQQGIASGTDQEEGETPMPDRTFPTRQNLEP